VCNFIRMSPETIVPGTRDEQPYHDLHKFLKEPGTVSDLWNYSLDYVLLFSAYSRYVRKFCHYFVGLIGIHRHRFVWRLSHAICYQ